MAVMSRKLGRAVLAGLLLLVGSEARQSRVLAQEREATRQVKWRVPPDYPELARRMNLTGKVRVEVVVAADGRVTFTHPLGGHPLLVQAAETAVKKWKFTPASEATRQVVEVEFAGRDAH